MYPFKNILFCTDFSPLSRNMLKYAAAFTRQHNARLYIHNVQEGSLPPQVLRLSERTLAEHGYEWLVGVREELNELTKHEMLKDLDVHTLLTEGKPAAEILRVSKEYSIDLVIMATERRGAIERAIIGSTTETLLEEVTCPVLLSRHLATNFVYYKGSETTIALNRILFATDFSAHDTTAKQLALQLTTDHKSKLFVMHAIGVFLGYIRSVSLSNINDMELQIRRDTTEKLALIAQETNQLQCETILCEGRAYEEISKVAKDQDADLIVIGVGNRHTGHALGRNAERVIRNASCPVLVVPN